MCSDDKGTEFWKWWHNLNNNTGNGDFNTTVTIWYTCSYCNSGLQYWTQYCPYCGKQLWENPPEPTRQEVIEKLDKIIREINELKARLIKDE